MKVDFLGPYREVARATERSARSVAEGAKQGAEFARLLAHIAPLENPKNINNSDGLREPGGTRVTPPSERLLEQLAFYRLPQPEPIPPPIELLRPPEVSTELVKQAPEGVKTSALEPNGKGDSVAQVAKLLQAAGGKHGVDPVLGLAVVEAESSFNPRAVSSDGHESKGLFQLLDRTARDLLTRAGSSATYEPFDPQMNVDLGVGYLRYLHDLFSRDSALNGAASTKAAANSASLEKLAVAAFNAGEGRVAAAQERALRDGKDPAHYEQIAPYLPESTQQYVQRIVAAKTRYEGSTWG